MTALTREQAIKHINQIEQQILLGKSYLAATNISWMGIDFHWTTLPKSKGGKLKRNKVLGNIIYSYREKELSKEEVIAEVTKPAALRRALIEIEAVIECSMCAKVVVGEEALNAYEPFLYDYTPVIIIKHIKRPWSHFLYQYDDTGKEPTYLTLCPTCMDNIFKGQYR